MKICTKCKDEKDLSLFNKNKSKKDGLNNICKTCSSARSKQYYKENREHHIKVIRDRNNEIILNNRQNIFDYYKTHPCVGCGETDPIVLEFDHKDNVDKKANISNLVGGGYSWEIILKEINKCDVRCANCHRRRTALQQGWYKGIITGCGLIG